MRVLLSRSHGIRFSSLIAFIFSHSLILRLQVVWFFRAVKWRLGSGNRRAGSLQALLVQAITIATPMRGILSVIFALNWLKTRLLRFVVISSVGHASTNGCMFTLDPKNAPYVRLLLRRRSWSLYMAEERTRPTLALNPFPEWKFLIAPLDKGLKQLHHRIQMLILLRSKDMVDSWEALVPLGVLHLWLLLGLGTLHCPQHLGGCFHHSLTFKCMDFRMLTCMGPVPVITTDILTHSMVDLLMDSHNVEISSSRQILR